MTTSPTATVQPMTRAAFFAAIRKTLFNKLTQLQVDSITALLDECVLQEVTDKRHVAYILGTAYHECYNPKTPETRLTPMKEFGGASYLQSKKYFPYFGRGFVQLTWEDNYKKVQKVIKTLPRFAGYDIVANPDNVLDVKISAFIAVYGMRTGLFTGKKLADYTTFVTMRAIINGKDKASLIASYANSFLTALG